MKSEPSEYSIVDLEKDGVEMWDGVRNYQVRNFMRDEMRVGDLALFYHSNAGKETGVVGVMKIVRNAYPDPTQFDKKNKHYDAKSTHENPRWLCVDVEHLETFRQPLTLSEIKTKSEFSSIPLVQKGNRLSIMPLSDTIFNKMIFLSKNGG